MIKFERMRLQDPYFQIPADSATARAMTSAWFATPPQEAAIVTLYNQIAADIVSISTSENDALRHIREATVKFAPFKRANPNTSADWESKFPMNPEFPERIVDIWKDFEANHRVNTAPPIICPAQSVSEEQLAKVKRQNLVFSILLAREESLKEVGDLQGALNSLEAYYSICIRAKRQQERVDDLQVPPGSDGGITPFDSMLPSRSFGGSPLRHFCRCVLG